MRQCQLFTPAMPECATAATATATTATATAAIPVQKAEESTGSAEGSKDEKDEAVEAVPAGEESQQEQEQEQFKQFQMFKQFLIQDIPGMNQQQTQEQRVGKGNIESDLLSLMSDLKKTIDKLNNRLEWYEKRDIEKENLIKTLLNPNTH